MKKTLICTALAVAMGVVGTANAASVVSMTIEEIGTASGGLGTSTNGGSTPLNGGIFFFSNTVSNPPVANGSANSPAVNFVSAGSTDGKITNGTTQQNNDFSLGFAWGGAGTAFSFLPNSAGSSLTCATAGTGCSGTGLVASHAGTTLTIDLSSWGGWYKPFNFQFPLFPDTAATVTASALGAGSLNADQFYYTMDWSHLITAAENGFFAGNIADWHVEGIGTIAAVPVPAAVWLFGSGLVGLVGIARRKQKIG
jgi:hypothetical protein